MLIWQFFIMQCKYLPSYSALPFGFAPGADTKETQGRGDAWNFGSFEHLFSFWIKFVIFCLIYEYCELLKVNVLTPMFIQFQSSPGIPAPHHPPYVRACCLFLISLKNDCLNQLWHKYLSPGLFMFTEILVCNFACANTF